MKIAVRALGLLLLAAGCASQTIEEMDFCPALAAAECGAVKGNCAVADEGACVIHREFECQVANRKLQTQSKGFNPAMAGACVRKVEAVYAQAVIPAVEWREVERTCRNIFWGQRVLGEACMSDRECESDNVCRERVCARRFARSDLDNRCGTGPACANGTVCDWQALGGPTCIKLPTAGMPCTRAGFCADDTRCDKGTCVARLPVGAACVEDDDCQPPSAFCDPATLVCAIGFAVIPESPFCEPFRRQRPGDAAPRPDVTPRGDGREAAVDEAAAVDVDPGDAGPDRPD